MPRKVAKLTLRCVGCKATRDVVLVPYQTLHLSFCERCFMPMLAEKITAKRASAKARGEQS